MAWYHFHSHSGGGHQSKRETYVWLDEERDDEDLRIEWDEWTHREHCQGHITGGVEKVDSLPADWQAVMVHKYQHLHAISTKMLTILGEKPDENYETFGCGIVV